MSYNGPYPMLLLKTLVASNSATLDFTQFSTRFSSYLFICSKLNPQTNGAVFQCLVNTGSGYIVTNYQSGMLRFAYNSATPNNSNSTTAIILSGPQNNSNSCSAFINVFNVTNGSPICMSGNYVGGDSSLATTAFGEFGATNTATNITAIRFLFSTGNIVSGHISLYGVLE